MPEISGTSSGTVDLSISGKLTLANNPNPFLHSTKFVYNLPVDGRVALEIHNMLGAKVNTLLDETQSAGLHTLQMNAEFLKTGVYTATLKLITKEGAVLTRTIKIIKNQ